jgi:hypothetical protein
MLFANCWVAMPMDKYPTGYPNELNIFSLKLFSLSPTLRKNDFVSAIYSSS